MHATNAYPFLARKKIKDTTCFSISSPPNRQLGLTPRPQELVRFLEPHTVGRPAAPVTVALDAARRAAAKSGDLESDGGLVDLSDVFAVPTAAAAAASTAGGGSRGGRRRAVGGLSVLEGGRRKAQRPDGPIKGRYVCTVWVGTSMHAAVRG